MHTASLSDAFGTSYKMTWHAIIARSHSTHSEVFHHCCKVLPWSQRKLDGMGTHQLFDLIIRVGIFFKCSGEISWAQTNRVNKRDASTFVRYVNPFPIGLLPSLGYPSYRLAPTLIVTFFGSLQRNYFNDLRFSCTYVLCWLTYQ